MRAEETIRISLTAAIELIDTATGDRYREKTIKVQLPMGLKWQRKEDGYLILTGSSTRQKLKLHIEGADIAPVSLSFIPDKENIIRIPVYPSPMRVRKSGIFYQEGLAAQGNVIFAELENMTSAVRLKEAYTASKSGCWISLFSRQNIVFKGQSFVISEGDKKESFTILGESEGKSGSFILEKPLKNEYGVKAVISPVIKAVTVSSGRYLLAYPKEKIKIGRIYEEK